MVFVHIKASRKHRSLEGLGIVCRWKTFTKFTNPAQQPLLLFFEAYPGSSYAAAVAPWTEFEPIRLMESPCFFCFSGDVWSFFGLTKMGLLRELYVLIFKYISYIF